MENNSQEVGYVSSTIARPANESIFEFIIKKNSDGQEVCTFNPYDLIKIERTFKTSKQYLFAMVESISSISDAPDHIANYVSQNFGTGENVGAYRMIFYCVSARVLKSCGNNYFPVKTGDKVYTLSKEETYEALYVNYKKHKTDYFGVASLELYDNLKLPLMLNKKYIVGPDAAHLNVSGMSGVASKTTKAMTILRELYHSDNNISIVIFNTKDKDLLNLKRRKKGECDPLYEYLDRGREDKWDSSISVLGPNCNGKERYILDFNTQCKKENIDLLLATDSDDTGTMDNCIKLLYKDKANKSESVSSWGELIEKNFIQNINNLRVVQQKFRRIVSRVLTTKSMEDGIFADNGIDLTENVKKKLNSAQQRVLVIDIAPLDVLQQSVVFGCVMREIKKFCSEQSGAKKPKKVAVFIDEFNKYASQDISPQNPILTTLIDVAESGRSIGLGLVTAEQSFSLLNRRIKANYANLIVGRTSIAELSQIDYMMIPDSFKSRIGTFDHGEAIVYTTYLNSGVLYSSFPDKFYKG